MLRPRSVRTRERATKVGINGCVQDHDKHVLCAANLQCNVFCHSIQTAEHQPTAVFQLFIGCAMPDMSANSRRCWRHRHGASGHSGPHIGQKQQRQVFGPGMRGSSSDPGAVHDPAQVVLHSETSIMHSSIKTMRSPMETQTGSLRRLVDLALPNSRVHTSCTF